MNTVQLARGEQGDVARARETEPSPPVRPPAEQLLALQRSAGNAAVARLLARQSQRSVVKERDPAEEAEGTAPEPEEPDEFDETEEAEAQAPTPEPAATASLARKTTAPPVLKIKPTTKFKAPSGSRKRTTVGVGEDVTFAGNVKGAWTASGGTELAPVANGKKYKWRASDRAGTFTITLTAGTQTTTTTMTVIEPNAITANKLSTISFKKGEAGAGMKLQFVYHPLNVSFGNVEVKEVSGGPTNVTGYYTGLPANDLWHDSGDQFTRVRKDNKDSAKDTAQEAGLTPPYTDGTYDWVIPNNFKTIHEGGGGKLFATTTHAVQLEGPPHAGRVTISKGGQSTRRSP